jgi:hypothetical protein
MKPFPVPIAAAAALMVAAPLPAIGAPTTTTSATRPPSVGGVGLANPTTGTAQTQRTSPPRSANGATGARIGQGAAGAAAATPNTTPSATTGPAGGATTGPAGASTGPAAGGSTTPSRPPALVGAPASANPTPQTPRHGSGHISTLAIVIAAIGALLALACAAWGLARRRAVEPHWWLSFQHAIAEARYRASATWAEFTDWARRGH